MLRSWKSRSESKAKREADTVCEEQEEVQARVNSDIVEVEEEKEQVLGCSDDEVVLDGLDEVKPSVEGEEEYVIFDEGEGMEWC